MKEIINLQINAFGYEVAGNSGINDTPGYANAHDDEKEAVKGINVARQSIIDSHGPLVPSFQQ